MESAASRCLDSLTCTYQHLKWLYYIGQLKHLTVYFCTKVGMKPVCIEKTIQ